MEQLQQEVHAVMIVLPSLTPQAQQAFMNGVVEVSEPEKQFAAQVIQQIHGFNAQISGIAAGIHADNQRSGAKLGCALGGDCSWVDIYVRPH
jgi:hypothetical protein